MTEADFNKNVINHEEIANLIYNHARQEGLNSDHTHWLTTVFRRWVLRVWSTVYVVSDKMHAVLVEMRVEDALYHLIRTPDGRIINSVRNPFFENTRWRPTRYIIPWSKALELDLVRTNCQKHMGVIELRGFAECIVDLEGKLTARIKSVCDWLKEMKPTRTMLMQMSAEQVFQKEHAWKEHLKREEEKQQRKAEDEADSKATKQIWISKDKKFKIVKIVRPIGFKREGRLQHNCMKHNNFLELNKVRDYYSYRTVEENRPIYTIEVVKKTKQMTQVIGNQAMGLIKAIASQEKKKQLFKILKQCKIAKSYVKRNMEWTPLGDMLGDPFPFPLRFTDETRRVNLYSSTAEHLEELFRLSRDRDRDPAAMTAREQELMRSRHGT